MTATLLTGIGEVVTCAAERGDVDARHDTAVVVEGESIAWIGPEADAPQADERIDLAGRTLIPGFVDTHAHLVFDGDRSAEFAARMAGQRYDGGGISVTVEATRAARSILSASSPRPIGKPFWAASSTPRGCAAVRWTPPAHWMKTPNLPIA